MKKLVSVLLMICLLIGFLPIVANAGDTFVDFYGFDISGISSQNKTVYGNTIANYENVFTIDFQLIDEVPKTAFLGWTFNLNENDGKDVSGLALDITIDVPPDYSYCHGICNVVITADVEPGVYYFSIQYDGTPILSEETHESILGLTVSAYHEEATVVDAGRSLSLSDIVYINNYARIEGTGSYTPEYIRSNGGLLVFNTEVMEEAATYAAAQVNGYIIPGLIGGTGNEYAQRTNGITSVQYRNTYYMRIFLKLNDGTYIYTPLKEYGVHIYCTNKLANGSNASQALKNVCQALLDYGDYASVYFGNGGTT